MGIVITNIDGSTFKDDYLLNYSSLMKEAVKEGTPFAENKKFIEEQVSSLNLMNKEKAEIMAKAMTDLTVALTGKSMEIALVLTEKALKIKNEISNLNTQTEIVTETKQFKIDQAKAVKDLAVNTVPHKINLAIHTATKMKNEGIDVAEKTKQLIRSVDFNNIIKAMEHLAEMIGTICAGGLVPPKQVFVIFFLLNKKLSNIAAPEEENVLPVKVT